MLGISFSKPHPKYREKNPKVNFIIEIICGLTMYSMILFFALADIVTFVYQEIYFTFYKIPKVKRSDYVTFDRFRLNKLSFPQRIACLYCDYANGISAWTRAVVQQTELYACAIKQHKELKGQEHREQYEYLAYEDYV